jgi:hypothetical protein
VKRLEQVSNRFSALKTRKEVLALLQSAKTSSTATRRFTSGYFLAARSAQSLNFQTASKGIAAKKLQKFKLSFLCFLLRYAIFKELFFSNIPYEIPLFKQSEK